MDALTPNILPSSFSNWELGTLVVATHVQEVGFNQSKQAINSGIIVLHHIQKQDKLLHHGTHDFLQFVEIWNEDPT